jgi:Spy/CpxP family protein refolding chaperone
MIPTRPCTWRNPRILVTLLLVFLCGASLGMVTMSLRAHRWTRPSLAASKESEKELSLARFKKELNLTPEQAQQLETVLDDFFMYYHTLQAQLDDVRATGKNRILRILNEEQKRKFEKMVTALQEKQLR